MISTQPTHRTIEAWRVEAPYLDSPVAEPAPEAPRGLHQCAEPIVEQSNPHAFLRLGDECVPELIADCVVANNVVLEMHGMACRTNRPEPCGIILFGVLEKPDAIAGDQRRARGGRESLCRHQMNGGRRRRALLVQIRIDHIATFHRHVDEFARTSCGLISGNAW